MQYAPDKLQKIALGLMGGLVVLTFMLANAHALLWQSSDWLVGAVLPSTVVQLTNEERSDNNASPLLRNATLDAAAAMKAEHMARNGYFAHFAPDGTSPWYWFDQAGYVYAHAGENLAIHFTDSDEVVDAWMNSPTHRANIVDSKFTEIGVGTAKGKFNGHNTVYVVQLFGTPAYIPPTPVAQTPPPAQVAVVTPEPATVVVEQPESTAVLAAEDNTATPVGATAAEEPENVSVTEPETTQAASESEASSPQAIAQESEAMSGTAANVPAVPAELAAQPTSLQMSMMSISSGLAAANSVPEAQESAQEVSFLSLATQPNTVLQVSYTLIALAVFVLLILSFVNELKHAHPVQMAYSVALLLLMVGLYQLHATLTQGAIIV